MAQDRMGSAGKLGGSFSAVLYMETYKNLAQIKPIPEIEIHRWKFMAIITSAQ
jgi:hypothetical protein